MSLPRRSTALALAAAVLADAARLGTNARYGKVEVQLGELAPTAPRHQVKTKALARRGITTVAANGGKRRKAAIKAARLRKYGTKRFGRYR